MGDKLEDKKRTKHEKTTKIGVKKMKIYNVTVKDTGDNSTFIEPFKFDDDWSDEECKEEIERVFKKFNSTLRMHETPREILKIEKQDKKRKR